MLRDVQQYFPRRPPPPTHPGSVQTVLRPGMVLGNWRRDFHQTRVGKANKKLPSFYFVADLPFEFILDETYLQLMARNELSVHRPVFELFPTDVRPFFRSMIYVAPSGVQKERLDASDLFVLKNDGSVSQYPPQERKLTLSQCTPLFMNAFKGKQTFLILFFQTVSAPLLEMREPYKILKNIRSELKSCAIKTINISSYISWGSSHSITFSRITHLHVRSFSRSQCPGRAPQPLQARRAGLPSLQGIRIQNQESGNAQGNGT